MAIQLNLGGKAGFGSKAGGPAPKVNTGQTPKLTATTERNIKANSTSKAPAAANRGVKAVAPKRVAAPKAAKAPRPAAPKVQNLGNGILSNNPLLNPNATLSGKALYQAALGVANAQTSPTISGLQSQIKSDNANTAAQTKLVSGAYNSLGQQGQNAYNETLQNNSALQGQLSQNNQTAQQALISLGQQAQQGGIGNLAQLGIGNGSQAVSADLARQQGLQAVNQANFGNVSAGLGANSANLAANGQQVGALQGIAGLKAIGQAGAANTSKLQTSLASAQGTRSADLASALEKLRQNEVSNQISASTLENNTAKVKQTAVQNAATDKIAGQKNQLTAAQQKIVKQNDLANQSLKGQSLAQTKAQDAAANSLKQEGINISAQNANVNAQYKQQMAKIAQQNANTRAKGGTGTKMLSTALNNKQVNNLTEIAANIQHIQQVGIYAKSTDTKPTIPHPTEVQIRSLLARGGYDDALIQAAYELDGWGVVTPATATQLQQQGVSLKGGSFRGSPIRIANPPKS